MHATRTPYCISESKFFSAEMHYIDYILTGKIYKAFFKKDLVIKMSCMLFLAGAEKVKISY